MFLFPFIAGLEQHGICRKLCALEEKVGSEGGMDVYVLREVMVASMNKVLHHKFVTKLEQKV